MSTYHVAGEVQVQWGHEGTLWAVDTCLGPTGLRNNQAWGGPCLVTTTGNSPFSSGVMDSQRQTDRRGPLVNVELQWGRPFLEDPGVGAQHCCVRIPGSMSQMGCLRAHSTVTWTFCAQSTVCCVEYGCYLGTMQEVLAVPQ